MSTSRDHVLKTIGHKRPEVLPATLYLDDILRQKIKDRFGLHIVNQFENDTIRILLKEPDASKIPRISLLPKKDRILKIRKENPDKFIYYQFTMTFGERLWALRGMEQYLTDLVLNQTFIHKALDLLLEMHLENRKKI